MSEGQTLTEIGLRVNGRDVRLCVRPGETLLEVLRKRLRLTGTKRGCEIGECGACTVVMDGRAVNSCLVLAVQADGSEVLTIEGLGRPGHLHPLQESFLNGGAVQCGFCTPGAIMSAYALLLNNPSPSEFEVRRAIAGNLCRCTGYQLMVDAVLRAAEIMQKRS